MAGRKAKVTIDRNSRKYQRDRTTAMQKHDKSMSNLSTSPPSDLVGIAKDVYVKIAAELNDSNVIKNIDKNVVVALCQQIQINRTAYRHIYIGIDGKDPEGIQTPIYKAVQGSNGEVIEHLFLGYRKNPAVQILDSSTAKIKSLCETLGMTPSSRASLLDIIKNDDNDDDVDLKQLLSASGPNFTSGGDTE
ncbi:phage terminase small subunit P27 family [Limosilactobacillus antri]|uniref:phage terminase small subunit P27 family n=1 Tax=Limosilactobacillus antri TaxID=227943 RepID=UPI001F57EC07|nr:phage terminase small subunit P27 family [Limosilactobacillus antri]